VVRRAYEESAEDIMGELGRRLHGSEAGGAGKRVVVDDWDGALSTVGVQPRGRSLRFVISSGSGFVVGRLDHQF